MAVLSYAKNYALTQLVPASRIPTGEDSGYVLQAYDEVTFAANIIAATDTIPLALRLPAGARILEATIIAPSLGAGTFQLGTVGVPTALIASAVTSAAVKAQTPAGAADLGKKLTVDTDYQLTCTVATSAALGLRMQVWIQYVLV